MTIATQAANWEEEIAAHGAEAAALFEAQLATYELLMDVATRRLPLTEAWVRRLHEELTRPQETYTVHTPQGPRQEALPQGEYKSHPNHVELPDGTRHAYAPVSETRPEMERLVRELTTSEFEAAHALAQASYAHYALTVIHPFADGNGRVARALASTYLYRAARIPLVIFAGDREPYLDALTSADRGVLTAFSDYVGDAAISTAELIIDALKTEAAPDPAEEMEALRRLLTVQGGLTYTDIDSIANSLLITHFTRVLNEELGQLPPPTGVNVSLRGEVSGQVQPPDGYRNIVAGGSPRVLLQMTAPAPSEGRRDIEYRAFISRSSDENEDLFWLLQLGTETGAKLALRDVHPQLTEAAEQRLHLLAKRSLGNELKALEDEARNALSASAYLVEERG